MFYTKNISYFVYFMQNMYCYFYTKNIVYFVYFMQKNSLYILYKLQIGELV